MVIAGLPRESVTSSQSSDGVSALPLITALIEQAIIQLIACVIVVLMVYDIKLL